MNLLEGSQLEPKFLVYMPLKTSWNLIEGTNLILFVYLGETNVTGAIMFFNLVNAALYFVGYLICVYGGAAKETVLPPILTFLAIGAQLLFVRKRSLRLLYQDILLLSIGALFGLAIETAFISSGFLTYATENSLFPYFPPAWLWSIYFFFLMTVNHSLKWVLRFPLIGLIFGAIGGPICYQAGAAIGGVTFSISTPPALIILGAVMALFVYMIFRFNLVLSDIVKDVFTDSRLTLELNVCYDDRCPVCRREKRRMQLADRRYRLDFVDINKADFNKRFPKIEIKKAFEEIHTVDDQGRVDSGINALSRVYACVGKRWLAIFLRLPLFHPILSILYRLFARHRPQQKKQQK
jgi:predicted DCC family thiol-disulfide oxidoreductase YuxK